MPELVFFRRGEAVLRVGVDRARLVLGRGEQSDVAIPDPEVSRQQVALLWDGTRCRVQDLSGKGTLVGGTSVTEAELPDGADLVLGQWRAVFRLSGGGEGADVATEVGHTTSIQKDAQAPRWQPAQVRVKQGLNESVHRLTGDSFTAGKDAGCDLVLQDRFASSKHLKVTRREGTFHVVDLRSTNGTWLGPVRLFEAEVTLPTTLRVGETELVLEVAATGSKKEVASFHGIIGNDSAVKGLADLIERVAPSTAAVTILGESGTGKELVAKAIHQCSQRANKPLVPVNCAAISKELIESELFGHEKGSFTGAANARKGAFEEADGGTLFLDEIGELPLDLQAKLLRALESGEIKRVGASRPMHVDVRVVAATNLDLLAAARENK